MSSTADPRVIHQSTNTMKKRQKVTLILLLAIIVLGGAFLYIRTLDRDEIEERPDSALLAPEEVSDPDEATEVKDVKAESEPEQEEVDLQVKVVADELPVIFEDGDYENLDRARLIWTVNNLFESVYDFEFAEYGSSRRYHINGREVETNLYLHQLGRGMYTPDILRKIGYKNIVEVDGINHLVLSREFIEAFIEASSEYGELTDELNNFIDRLNQVKSVEIDNLTELQIDSMLHLDQSLAANAELEQKRLYLKGFTVNIHFQSTNVFWLEESIEVGRYLYGDDAEPQLFGQAIYYRNRMKDRTVNRLRNNKEYLDLLPSSNFDSRLHTEPDEDPDEEPFIWVPTGRWAFIFVDRQWKIVAYSAGT